MKHVVVIPMVRNEKDDVYTSQAVSYFLKNGAAIHMASEHKGMQYSSGAVFADGEELYKDCDLITVLGGDGSILRAAEKALKYDVPIFGINLGRLGYMAEIEKSELYLIDNIYSGNCYIEKRMVLSVELIRAGGEVCYLGDALNDVVLNRGGYTRSIDIDLYADGRSVRTIRADGLIIATPTGSTAYSMAAGGSVLDPTLECICATPVCPVSRYACPIVFSGNSVLEAALCDDRTEEVSITVDGESAENLRCGDRLIVKRSVRAVKMLSVKNEGFFEILNNKISKYELKK